MLTTWKPQLSYANVDHYTFELLGCITMVCVVLHSGVDVERKSAQLQVRTFGADGPHAGACGDSITEQTFGHDRHGNCSTPFRLSLRVTAEEVTWR